LIILIAAAIYFVTVSSAGLPPLVTSHFNAPGVADGFMTKENYTFTACILVVFLSYVHWLVVLANAHQPPVLSGSGIYAGLIFLMLLIGIWSWVLIRAFHLNDHPKN
jgi:hypothetical protein